MVDINDIKEQAEEVAKQSLPAIKTIGDSLLAWLQSGADLAKEQAPMLAKEILSWGAFEALVWMAFGLLLVLIGASIINYNWRHWREPKLLDKSNNPHPLAIFSIIFSCVGILIGTIVSMCNAFVIGKIYFAPRVYLIEFLFNLIHPAR